MLLQWFALALALSLPAASAATLQLEVLQGDGAIHDISSKNSLEPVVQLTDDQGNPVGSAAVTFVLPDQGPGGRFPSGTFLTTTTDDNGVAKAYGLKPNRQTGQWEIRVSASHHGAQVRTTILQTNAAPLGIVEARGGSRSSLILAIAAGGAAAGLAAVLGGGGKAAPPQNQLPQPNSPVPVPTTISTGTGSVGRP